MKGARKLLLYVISGAQIVVCQSSQNGGFTVAPAPIPRQQSVQPADGSVWAETPEAIDRVNRRLATEGNTKAAYQLGLAYMQGFGVPQSIAEADRWLTIGATRAEDKALVGDLYMDGAYLPPNPAEADRWLTAAGRSVDLFELAEMYRKAQPSQAATAAAIYRKLLGQTGSPEVRMAQLKLGELVLSGRYSAGADPAAQALNLEWARSLAQELLGQSEYNIAVDYAVGREGIPVDHVMWARYCARAAAYNIDLAQEFFGRAILEGTIADAKPLEGYLWLRLSADKQYQNRLAVQALEAGMDAGTRLQAEALYNAMLGTRRQDGAYYRPQDPLGDVRSETLLALPEDDPDVELRRAFALESVTTSTSYTEAMEIYRKTRDTSWMAAMAVLGRKYMQGTDGMAPNPVLARRWLERSVEAGYHPAALVLAGWYRGSGGGTVDPVQALAWSLIGRAKPAPVPEEPKNNLSPKQRSAAEQQYQAWITAHPGW